MVQISQTELERRYVTITCLEKRQRMPKDEKKIAKWAQYGKLHWSKNYPYEQIINPHLNSMEFWLSNNSVSVESGTYRKIGAFTITLEQRGMASVSPTWKMVLEYCPAQYAIEGVGLYLNTLKFEKTTTVVEKSEEDFDDIIESKKTWTVWVMKKTVPYSKEWLKKCNDQTLERLTCLSAPDFEKAFTLANNVHLTLLIQNYDLETVKKFLRIVREREFRSARRHYKYCSFLKRSTVIKIANQEYKKNSDFAYNLVRLTSEMKDHPERFWILQNIDG